MLNWLLKTESLRVTVTDFIWTSRPSCNPTNGTEQELAPFTVIQRWNPNKRVLLLAIKQCRDLTV